MVERSVRAGGVAIFLFALASAFPAAAACQFQGPGADEVRAREIAFAASMADRDLEAFGGFVSAEAIFFGQAPLRGKEAVVEAWAAFFEGAEAPFSWEPDMVQVVESGTLALSSGPVRSPSGEVVGRFNSMWRKEADGQWRVLFDKGS